MNPKYGSQKYYYEKFYPSIIGLETKGLFSFLSKYPHYLMEKPFKSNLKLDILELGYGKGEHLRFVSKDYNQYIGIDKNNYAGKSLKVDKKLKFIKMNAESLNFPDTKFDRIIATCLVVHLKNIEKALLEWRRVLKPNGVITMYIALEPSIMLRLFRNMIVKRKVKKLGFTGYDLFIAREHINHAIGTLEFINYIFKDDEKRIKYSPFPFLSWNFNLFAVIHITKVKTRLL